MEQGRTVLGEEETEGEMGEREGKEMEVVVRKIGKGEVVIDG